MTSNKQLQDLLEQVARGDVDTMTARDQLMQAFSARPYDVYELQSSANMQTWVRATNAITPTVTNMVMTNFVTSSNRQFFRVQRVP